MVVAMLIVTAAEARARFIADASLSACIRLASSLASLALKDGIDSELRVLAKLLSSSSCVRRFST